MRGTEPRLDSPKNRADDGTRTRDPHLGKVMLYQLSHIRDKPEKSNPSILHISERGLQILGTPEISTSDTGRIRTQKKPVVSPFTNLMLTSLARFSQRDRWRIWLTS